MTPVWLKYLPVTLRARIENRTNLQKIISNTGWLFADKIIRMGVGLVVGVWIARYLGPEKFGLLNYSIAIVAMFGPISSFGLNGIVVRDLVKETVNSRDILGTTFILQIIGGLLTFVLGIITINYTRENNDLAKLVVMIFGFAMVFKATEVVKYWYESQVKSKFIVLVENGIFLIFASIKVILILSQATLLQFAWITFIEGLTIGIGLLCLYAWHFRDIKKWRFKYIQAKELLSNGWPMILSGLAVMIYMRIDQIILGQLLGDESVGIYTAAVRISEVWYFIPTAIISSVFPSILAIKKNNESLYLIRLQKLYNLMVLLALFVAVPMTFFSGWIIQILFGSAYSEAGPVLAIHIWSSVFVFLGLASGSGYLAENLQKLAFYRTLLGAIINVATNFFLIPIIGILGAAIGTLLAQISAAYLFDFLHPKTKIHFFMKTKSIFSFYKINF